MKTWLDTSGYYKAAKLEETEKILIDPSLEGKSREEMGLEPFVDTKIRSSVMGIPVFISQDVIAYVIRRASEGNFKDGLDNNKKSPWNEVFHQTMFNSKKNSANNSLSMEKKMLLKIQNENLLPKEEVMTNLHWNIGFSCTSSSRRRYQTCPNTYSST